MNTTIRSIAAAVAMAAFAFSAPVSAQQKIKIGFISTFSGRQGVMGQYMKESVELAIEQTSSSPTSACRSPRRC